MDNRRLGITTKTRRTALRHHLAAGISVTALSMMLSLPMSASAQEQNLVVDLADPNVSVDLSVLNDGGLAPQMGAPVPAPVAASHPTGAAYQAPGKKTPVSTLYIKPTSSFKLPPQTKAIESKMSAALAAPVAPPPPAPAAPEPAPAEPVVAEATPETVPAPVEIAETPATLQAPMPEPAPEPEPVAEAAPVPEPTPEPAQEVAAVTPPPPPVAVPEPDPAPAAQPEPAPEPEPESQPVALEAEAPSTPPTAEAAPAPVSEPEPEAEVAAAPSEAVAPPPPPQAAPVAAPVEHDETQTAPAPQPNEVVLPIPPKDPEVAALPPATGPLSDGDSMRIVFDTDSSKLPQQARDELLVMAGKMRTQDALRLQLLAYAGNADTSASAARRLSLSRALAVRSFLIENGVRSTRIDVRALGNKSTEVVTERVDITVVER